MSFFIEEDDIFHAKGRNLKYLLRTKKIPSRCMCGGDFIFDDMVSLLDHGGFHVFIAIESREIHQFSFCWI